MGKAIDLTGRRFGRLVVIERAGTYRSRSGSHSEPLWRCRCDCGSEWLVRRGYLISGQTRSCGCLRSDSARDRMRKIYADAKAYLEGEQHDAD